jgi:hypothetical protein
LILPDNFAGALHVAIHFYGMRILGGLFNFLYQASKIGQKIDKLNHKNKRLVNRTKKSVKLSKWGKY